MKPKKLYRGIRVGHVSVKFRLPPKPGVIIHFFGYALHVNAHKIQKGITIT
jgi:hypothetical protein